MANAVVLYRTYHSRFRFTAIFRYLPACMHHVCGCVYNQMFAPFDPKKELLIKKVRKAWPKHLPTPVIKPVPVLTFPNPAFVPRDKQVLYTAGMRGWFHPEKRMLLQVTFGDTQVDFTALGLWDSDREGRVGQIIQRSPRTQHAFLRNHFFTV